MVDEKDTKILKELLKDGRKSLRQLAETLKMSPSTISNRFHSLEDNNIIERFQPVINYQKIGYELTTITQIKVESGTSKTALEEIKQIDFVRSVFLVTGETDLIVISKFKDRKEMNNGSKTIRNVEGIIDSKTNVVLESEEQLPILIEP